MSVLSVVDFFCGCGGTSAGFRNAGARILGGVDCDKDAGATYQKNFPEAFFIERQIEEIDPADIVERLANVEGKILFSGCAPCQPFSKQNRHQKKDDKRKNLLSDFGRMVSFCKPDFVFVENVPGIQKLKEDGPFPDFLNLLKKLGYEVSYDVVSAAFYGVPQDRKRLVLLAARGRKPVFPIKKEKMTTVRDWISDLPELVAGSTDPTDPHHQASALSIINLKRIQATPEGGGRKSWPEELRLACHKTYNGHSDVYGRLSWDEPSSVLTTRCISYSNGRFGHPEQDRALSVREAACLQTFPRNYDFCGSPFSKARQIGNAVPPLMAEKFARVFLEM